MSLTREEIAEQYIDDQLKPHYRKRLVSGLVSAIKHRERLAMEKMFDKLIKHLEGAGTQKADEWYPLLLKGTKTQKQELIDGIIS